MRLLGFKFQFLPALPAFLLFISMGYMSVLWFYGILFIKCLEEYLVLKRKTKTLGYTTIFIC